MSLMVVVSSIFHFVAFYNFFQVEHVKQYQANFHHLTQRHQNLLVQSKFPNIVQDF